MLVQVHRKLHPNEILTLITQFKFASLYNMSCIIINKIIIINFRSHAMIIYTLLSLCTRSYTVFNRICDIRFLIPLMALFIFGLHKLQRLTFC